MQKCQTQWSPHASLWWLSHMHLFWQTYIKERSYLCIVICLFYIYIHQKMFQWKITHLTLAWEHWLTAKLHWSWSFKVVSYDRIFCFWCCFKRGLKKVLLAVVGDLAILEVKFVHEGLAIKEVIERLITDLKKPRAQTKKTSLQKWRNPTCETPARNKSDCLLWCSWKCLFWILVLCSLQLVYDC